MAKQQNLHFVGTVHNIIYYQWKQGFYMRLKPLKCRQTIATKKRSTNFGIAAKAARILRAYMVQTLPFPKDKKMQNRFTAAIVQWLGQETVNHLQPSVNLPFIQGFAFNTSTTIAARFRVPLTVMPLRDNFIEVAIPAFIPSESIQAPANTVSVICILSAAACRLQEGTGAGNYTTAISYQYNDIAVPAQTIRFPFTKQSGTLFTLSVTLEYFIAKKAGIHKSANPFFMPAGIVYADYV